MPNTITVTELLRRQHTEVKELFAQIEQAPADQRGELFDCLRRLLAVHETAEEIVVHPAARETGERGEQIVAARLAEEDQAKQALADLEKLGPDAEGFATQLLQLRRDVEAHAEAEETELFPLLEAEIDDDTLHGMADQVEVAESLAPTHPHPHGPSGPTGLLLTGPFVKMVDAVRDKLAGR